MAPPSPEPIDPQVISTENIGKALQQYTQLLAKSIARQIVRESEEQSTPSPKEDSASKNQDLP